MSVSTIDRYDTGESYEWNYQNAPGSPPGEVDVPAVPGDWTFCGLPVASPLGIPAGPLLNSRWILHYAALGFDVLTYKTVRSRFRASYDPPNLLPVEPAILTGEGSELTAAASDDSWAISFGMPSRDPAEWRADVERTRRGLGALQVLSVSVVASPEAGWTRSCASFVNSWNRWASRCEWIPGICQAAAPFRPEIRANIEKATHFPRRAEQ